MGFEIALLVVSAAILLSGIILGIGRSLNNKKLEQFGIEELLQSIINAAIIGAFATITASYESIADSLSPVECTEGNVLDQYLCVIDLNQEFISTALNELIKISLILGYYQTLTLDFSAFQIMPFANLDQISNLISMTINQLHFYFTVLQAEKEFGLFIKDSSLTIFLTLGIIFRTFFATRKLGGLLIASSIAAYLIYPSFVLVFPQQTNVTNSTIDYLINFTNNSAYAPVPIIDLNDNYAIAAKLDVMSGRCGFSNTTECVNATTDYNQSIDFTGDLTLITQKSSEISARAFIFAILAHIISLIISVVFVWEAGRIIGGEIILTNVARTV